MHTVIITVLSLLKLKVSKFVLVGPGSKQHACIFSFETTSLAVNYCCIPSAQDIQSHHASISLPQASILCHHYHCYILKGVHLTDVLCTIDMALIICWESFVVSLSFEQNYLKLGIVYVPCSPRTFTPAYGSLCTPPMPRLSVLLTGCSSEVKCLQSLQQTPRNSQNG